MPDAHLPRWRPEDLGRPIPDDPHAVSMCLPTWRDVIGYEEGDPRVLQALQAGYPRFVIPRGVVKLAATGGGGRISLPFVSGEAARRAAAHAGGDARARADERLDIGWVDGPADEVRRVWRYAGEGLSSRAAEAVLTGQKPVTADGDRARSEVTGLLASEHGIDGRHVHLFPSGMAAVFAVHRLLAARRPGRGVVQVDFPYVDVSRVQAQFGSCRVRRMTGEEAVGGGLLRAIEEGFDAGVYLEVPANPLLACADLPAVAALARAAAVPVVADDTVASSRNARLLPHADLVTTSLTKWVNGRCNLLAGAVTANPSSPLAAALAAQLACDGSSRLADGDAAELAVNCRDFAARMDEVNARAAEVVAFLGGHPAVDRVMAAHPGEFAAFAGPAGGAGGVISFTLHGGEAAAARFYDAVEVDKGPSLGADFSLLCPYALLAHYDELEDVRAWGVPRDLLRLSVGREPGGVLVGRLERAIEAAGDG